MKKTIYGILTATALLLASCSDFTDIQPKGKNLLSTTEQLEMLLNYQYRGGFCDMRVMAGDLIDAYSFIATEISKPQKTRQVIMWTYDEANMDKMAELTNNDLEYTYYYGIIGKISNPILTQIGAASGDEATKNQLRCEALTLRAWSLYMLVNKFAKAYNPSTATSDPGIIIMTEDKDVQQAQAKSTVQEVYDQILKDINEAIELNGLPDKALNKMRVNKAAAYAVKALTLLNMQKWDDAEAAAQQAIASSGTINDYLNSYQGTMMGYFLGNTYDVISRGNQGTEEDYLLNGSTEFFQALTAEAVANFEDGHVYKDRMSNANMAYDYTLDAGESMLGQTGFMITYDLDAQWNDGGLRSPQMYLAIAECEVQKGNIDNAMEYLDKVRVCRIAPEKYQPLKGTVSTKEDAIAHVKQVTLNEEIFSSNSFIDKKRWNQLDGWKATYSRKLVDKVYSIAPDSKMWIFPFPKDAVDNNPQLTQNYK